MADRHLAPEPTPMSGAAEGLLSLLVLTAAEPRAVGSDEILRSMARSEGYNLEATTNGARFQAEVILRLVREAQARDPERRPLFLGHGEWFSAYLQRTGLTAGEVPAFVRLAFEHGQDLEIDYREERVFESTPGAPPGLGANVIIWWPRRPGGPTKYSYEDLLSTPRLKVTNERVIAYRLVDFGDMVVYDEIEGLRGRPTSGALGFLFRLIGEGHVVQSRMAISADGLQISRARARKAFFGVTSTVTVYPDGRTEKDVPSGRPDLAALETRLRQPLDLRYRRLDEALRER